MTISHFRVECNKCRSEFTCPPEFIDFLKRAAFHAGANAFELPLPTLCPDCRQQRRLSWRNERALYRRICDHSGKSIISMYRSDAHFPVYERQYWWSDSWDPLSYGRDIDFSRPFFEQFSELLAVVPQFSVYNAGTAENSDFSNFTLDIKDCYLSFSVTHCQECLYLTIADRSQSCVDCLNIDRCELCYECVDCACCYHSFYLTRCTSCTDCWLCTDCLGCSNCIGCVSLVNAEYSWFNEKVGREEFEKRRKEFLGISYRTFNEIQDDFKACETSQPKCAAHFVNVTNCTGDRMANSKDCMHCFDVFESENVSFTSRSYGVKDSSDCYGVAGNELVYEAMSARGYRICFVVCSYDNSESAYLHSCFNNKHLFGCVGLRQAEYCILNKQYSKEEYVSLVPRLIEHMRSGKEWGEFFPPAYSPFGYNESVAAEGYALSRQEATAQGFTWSDFEVPPPAAARSIAANALPILRGAFPENLHNTAILCEKSARPFRLTDIELEFYRKEHLFLPRVHPDERHRLRLQRRNPRKLWHRSCEKCGSEIFSSYGPQRSEAVFCHSCFEAWRH